MNKVVIFLAFTVLATAATAQELMPGTNLPVTMKPSDLGADYKPLKLKEQSSGIFGDYYGSSSLQFNSIGFRGDEPRLRALAEILPVSWTWGQLAEVFGQKFVVTYILEPSIEDLQDFAQGKPLANVTLKLKLMKADQIGSIEPFPELTKEKYLALLAEFSGEGKPAFRASTKTSALSNGKQVGTSAMIYLADNDDIFPYVQSTPSLKKVLFPYSKNMEIWKTLNPAGAGEFRFNMSLAGVNSSDIEEVSQTPMLFDPTPFPDGTYLVVFADSSVRYVSAERWKELQKYMKLKLKRHGKPIKD